ncbi:FtsX-like permease family protein [Floricoccus penangensis]|uniref:FtsX-like permease family protein n=1 Tax=Floricoccus penangensis TaxID=1859475 RepID=UPI00203A3CD1|nr:FtsX-like permease family protein [Floricoccus penangensis]URZ87115.1 FtsX-like permease family protein [Floricoccus penangensis]
MSKKILNKDIRQSILKSKGRFFSIFALILLGVFAFTGLKISGPNLRQTAETFYKETNLADVEVISNYGLNDEDEKIINSSDGLDKAEFGYFTDVLLKNTKTSFRIFSKPDNISKYEIVEGDLPKSDDEIALDYLYKDDYEIGQEVEFTSDKDVLKKTKFKISGFVKSSEYTSKTSLGTTDIGTGQLNSYGVVEPTVFDSDIYMIARLKYKDTKKLSAYSKKYSNRVDAHKDELQDRLDAQKDNRLKAIKAEPQSKINDGQAKIESSKKEISNQEAKIKEQENQLSQAEKAGMSVPDQQKAQLNDAKKKITDAKSEVSDKEKDLKEKQSELDGLSEPVYVVSERSDNKAYKTYLENSKRVDILSNVFPVFLFAIAALVSLTTMTRFIEEERINSGTFRALGYSKADVSRKFVVYGLVSGLLGAIAGAALGYTLLPTVIFKAYTAATTFDKSILTFSWKYTLIAFAIALACTVLSSLFILWRELKELPVSLLQPKPPKAGSKILLEYITPLWNKMSFTHKVTARNIFRYKSRMFMTIFGVAGCTALLITGFGIRDSLDGISGKQYDELIKYDLVEVKKDDATNKENEEINKILSSEEVKSHESVRFEQVTKKDKNEGKQTINLIATQDTKNFNEFVNLRNRESHSQIELTDDGVVISEKFAQIFNLKVGDKFKVETSKETSDGKEVELKVSAITEMYMGHFIFMDSKNYQATFDKSFEANSNLVILKNDDAKSVEKVSSQLIDTDGVALIQENLDAKSIIDNVMDGLNSVILVLIICAILLAVVVIYNLTNINVSERIRELSTIKVLGFYDKEVTLYIYRETIILSALGIIVGWFLGALLHGFIISSLPPEDAMFNPVLNWTNYLISAAITLGITAVISVVIHNKIKNVNMLDALKSVE